MQAAEQFISRWQGGEGGQERANYALFLSELCDLTGVSRPDPASASHERNDYVFERVVTRHKDDGDTLGRIDLYKKGCFVLEAKQSRFKGAPKEAPGQSELFVMRGSGTQRGRRGADRAWDVLMLNAKRQAEDYARALPTTHGWPPFIMVCDVAHCIEVYADFSGQGKNYTQFPDRNNFQIYLEDLRHEKVRERLRKIWTAPQTLDPAQASASVTHHISKRLAQVSKALETKYATEDVANFLMRCLFTMFAEDVGLLPAKSFKRILEECEKDPASFQPVVSQLWEAMDTGGFAHALKQDVKRFNGKFFHDCRAMPLAREEIGELRQAASYDWKEVDPSIFGTLLEQALDKKERERLGAHYTPRAYVERLVIATVIEPLREDWRNVQATAERLRGGGDLRAAAVEVERFHAALCKTRVLDPACGTGNFLYVTLELMKRLEGEVLEALANLGGQERLALSTLSIDPHQFHGIEVSPRAAAIAELVLWIGYLQWHFRTRGGSPDEPILKEFRNIEQRNAVLMWDGAPKLAKGRDPYPNPRRPDWPQVEFIVGNPPFIGASFLRARLGDDFAEALWAAHSTMNESADFVMYWWDRAAELLRRKGTALRRFGFVTTNSISQVFQRRVMERHLQAAKPISLVMAIADHPWTKATPDAAAVRIAMTVGEAGAREGVLHEVVHESRLETDTPLIELLEHEGRINSDLTVGVDLAQMRTLRSTLGMCHDGVQLHGRGFVLSLTEAKQLGFDTTPEIRNHIRSYRNGRDLAQRPRDRMVIDFFGLASEQVRTLYPRIYQHLLSSVKPERDGNNRASYRDYWWIFGEPRREMRPALVGLKRYIATVDTARHRAFQFLDADIICDDKVVIVASDDALMLGILGSRIHVLYATRAGGWLGIGNDSVYTKTRTFDPFPFPDANAIQKHRIRVLAEELDAHRKRVLDEHAHLTLTGLYNVLDKVRAAASLNAKEQLIFDDGLVLILKELHDKLDVAVAGAYGWPKDASDSEILGRLVALNTTRAEEEKRGLVRWLRPEYQKPRFAKDLDRQALAEDGAQVAADLVGAVAQRVAFPADPVEQTAAVFAALSDAQAMDAKDLAAQFRKSKTTQIKIEAVLASLARIGWVTTGDGKTFALRRVA